MREDGEREREFRTVRTMVRMDERRNPGWKYALGWCIANGDCVSYIVSTVRSERFLPSLFSLSPFYPALFPYTFSSCIYKPPRSCIPIHIALSLYSLSSNSSSIQYRASNDPNTRHNKKYHANGH